MFRRSEDYVQNELDFLPEQEKKALDASKAKLIGDFIYPNIDESRFQFIFSSKDSRPNINIRVYVTAFILKAAYCLTDANLIEFLRCGSINIRYALHTMLNGEQPLSESSMRRFRRELEKYKKEHDVDLIKDECKRISELMAIDMGLLHNDPDGCMSEEDAVLIRMDSMMVGHHAKHMTRVEILYMTNVVVIRYLVKNEFEYVIPEGLDHYFKEGDFNRTNYYKVSADIKPSVQEQRISNLIEEMVLITDAISKYFTEANIQEIPEFKVIRRVLDEQAAMDDNGKRIPKRSEDIAADSVQNPFDLTMTYRNNRGKHYGPVLNLAEICDDNGNGIILDAMLEANITNDKDMAKAYVSSQPDDGPAKVISVDGGYNDPGLEEMCKDKNITLKTSALTGNLPPAVMAEFVLNDAQDQIITCPNGRQPTSCKFNERTGKITARMPENCYRDCPYREQCKAKVNNKKNCSTVAISVKSVHRARHGRDLTIPENAKIADKRNGVEGIMSVMRRKYKIDKIPAFGRERMETWIWSAILAYNLTKYQSFLRKKAIAEKMALAV